MKNLIYYIFIFIVLVACKDDDDKTNFINQPTTPTIDNGPIDFSENPLVFSPNKNTSQKVVLVSNDSTPLQFSIIDQPNWVYLNQTNGTIYDLYDFYVSIDQNREYPFGILKDSIEFFTKLGRSFLEVRYVNGDGDQLLHEDTVIISALGDTASLQLYNNTLEPINFSFNSPAHIMLNPQNSTIGPGLNKSILVTANRNNIPDSTVSYQISLQHGSVAKTIVVIVETFIENKIILNGNVIDAEYDHLNNALYYVTSNPSALVKFDPQTKLFSTLGLNYTPYCISLSKSGNYAAIGNDGTASLIDLQGLSLVSTFNTGAKAADIILKDSAFAYVLPMNGQHVKMKCVNLQNNYALSDNTGWTIYQNARGKLHPTQQAIYSVDNDVSPIDVEKFDVSNGIANLLYDSPYHGDYNFGGDLWFSADGNRIITKGKSVINATTTPSTDMIYSGSISLNIPASIKGSRSDWEFQLRHVDVNPQNGKMVLVAEDSYQSTYDKVINQVYIHQESNLQYINRIETEDFGVPDFTTNQYTYYPAEAYFSFFTSATNELIVITKATNSGLGKPWAIELLNY